MLLVLSIGCVNTPQPNLQATRPPHDDSARSISTGSCPNVSVGPNLFDRGGGLIFDADRNITWLQDANYAKTSGYDPTGDMHWTKAMEWTQNLVYYDPIRNFNWTDWRLPTSLNQDDSGPCLGYNCIDSEMGHLYYIELENAAGGPMINTVPFTNLQSYRYWSSTRYSSNPYDVWFFIPSFGNQTFFDKAYNHLAMAVRDGDVCTPATIS